MHGTRRTSCFGLALALATSFAAPRQASAEEDPPWAVGVSVERRTAAQKLLEAGNALFLDKRYAEALEQYKQAVATWDHPAIRFNIVRCLIQLDRGVEASDNLEVALHYGAAPLEESVYTEALAYAKLLANEIGTVDVACKQADVKITLDGQPLVSCPGAQSRRVAPGAHQLVGTRAGYLTQTSDVIVVGGKHAEVTLDLVPLERAGKIVHRWPTWMPWVVFGGGVVVGGMGGVLEGFAASNYRAYDDDVSARCKPSCAVGSDDYNALAHEKDRARTFNVVSIGVLATGVAATATGAVLLYMNRGRTEYPSAMVPAVTPLPGGGGALTWSGQF